MSAAGLYDRIRRPEYTGENRCLPCTAVNLVLALAAAAGLALLADPRYAAALGAAAFLVLAGAVAVRGYLLPGTPWLTRTYLPDRVLAWFDKAPARGRDDRVDVEGELVEAGLLVDCPSGGDLCLAPDVREAWRDRIEAIRREDTSRADLADVLGVEVEELSFTEHGEALLAQRYARPVGQWESRAAFVADVTAARLLEERLDGWDGRGVDERGQLLAGLRLFIERCPSCDGPVEFGEDVVDSCCRSYEVAAATCADCGARIFEAPLEAPG